MITYYIIHVIGSLLILFLGGNFIAYQHGKYKGNMSKSVLLGYDIGRHMIDLVDVIGILFVFALLWPFGVLATALYGVVRLLFLPAQLIGILVRWLDTKGSI